MAPTRGIFINCPFDEAYVPLLRPLLFTTLSAGFEPRIALERSDSGEVRLNKLCDLIASSVGAIHDLSRLRSSGVGELFRLNMAFELGLAYGHRMFSAAHTPQKLLVLETEQYEFMKALSDFSGMDIKSHKDDPGRLVLQVRSWFVETLGVRRMKPGTRIWYSFNEFMAAFYDERKAEGFEDEELQMMPVPELMDHMKEWIAAH